MTREEALALHAAVRYNLPNNRMKEAVDVAFEALGAQTALAEPVIPCKPGDTVYRLCGQKGHKYVAARVVISVTLCGGGQSWGILTTTHDWLGKTVFLTREEAEDALRRLEEV